MNDPVEVVLVTHGRSSSLILPRNGGATRWAYGDWNYYALGNKGSGDALSAVLWPTRAALGRQLIDAPSADPDVLVALLGIGIDRLFPIIVSGERVERLEARLQELFDANRTTLLYNPGPRLEFVEHPEAYSLVSNSNGRVAEWLRELGCEVTGAPLLSKWRIEPPEPTDPAAAPSFRGGPSDSFRGH